LLNLNNTGASITIFSQSLEPSEVAWHTGNVIPGFGEVKLTLMIGQPSPVPAVAGAANILVLKMPIKYSSRPTSFAYSRFI
jgi:hypothetical protein